MEPIVFLAFLGLGIAAIVGAARRVDVAWAKAAEELGLSFESGGLFGRPVIAGRVGDLEVEVTTLRRGSSDSASTRYRIGYPPFEVPFELRPASKLPKFLGFVGGDLGAPAPGLEDTFRAHTPDPRGLRALLGSERRHLLRTLAAAYRGLRVTASELVVTIPKAERDPTVIADRVRRLVEIARAFREAEPVDEPPEVPPEPEPTASFDLEPDAEPEMPPSRFPEPVIRYVSAPVDEAPAETTPEPDPTGLAADELAADLFGRPRLSFETEARFADRWAGTRIRWPGTVREARWVDDDRVFGERPMTRARLLVATIPTELYGEAEVEAIVALPPGDAERLRRDDEVVVAGVLVGIDGLLRRFYVADAELSEVADRRDTR